MLLVQKCIDLLFPRLCFGCGKIGSYACLQCLARECRPSSETFPKSKDVDMLVCATEYKGLFKKLITVAKYGAYKQVLIDVSEILVSENVVNNVPLEVRIRGQCAIYPVPMHSNKKKQRGFNQTESIASILSKKTGLPVITNRLFKTMETVPQASLSRKDRQQNVKGAFMLRDAAQLPKTVIVVDDVWTTGATIREIATLFKRNGVEKVIACTLARRWYNTDT
jgi:ComF family protein